MDVAAWLRDLGLERYVSAFRDNDNDAEVLLKLTAADLILLSVRADIGLTRLSPETGGKSIQTGFARTISPTCLL